MRVSRGAFVLLLFYAVAYAQQYTHLSGLIRDPTDAAVPHASITVVSEDTGFRRSAESGNDGSYVVSSLHPGLYKITVRKDGFRTVIRFAVKLDVAQPARVDFQLPLGSQQETITVLGTPPQVHTEDASVGTLVGREQVERMPLNGRGLLSLLELAPGTVVTPATRGESGQFTTNGQRPNMNYFTVDGVSANTGVSGGGSAVQVTGGSLPGMTALGSLHNLVPLEALDEFRVQTSSSSPEFGRLPGAQISLSSRSGSNEFHGSVFGYFRHDALDANDWFANRASEGKAPLRMYDYGASAGGPVRRDHTFFFASYEGMRLRQPYAWRTPTPTAAARETVTADWVRAATNLYPLPNGGPLAEGLAEFTGRNNRPAGLDTASARIDHALTSRISLFTRYQETPSYNQFGSTQISSLDLSSRSLTIGINARITHRAVLDFRWNYSRSAADSVWTSTNPAANLPCAMGPVTLRFLNKPGLCEILFRVQIAGVGTAAFGREPDRQQGQWHLLPTAVVNVGSHQARFGADYRRIRTEKQDLNGSVSAIAESLSDLLLLKNLWLASADPISATAELKEASVFGQDTWRIGSRLTATFGVRWEFAPTPVTSLPVGAEKGIVFPDQSGIWTRPYSNIAPRIGLAFSPQSNGNTAVRAGFGLYYDSSLSIGTDLVNGGPFTLGQYTSGRNAPFSTFLSFGFLPGLRLPLIKQWNVSVEHAFRGREVVSVTYAGSNGRRLLRREIGPDSTDTVQIALATNHGISDYHGLQLQFRRRLTHGLQITSSYSWSHSIDDSSSDSSLHWARGGLTAGSDRGNSDFDVRHAFSTALTSEFHKHGHWGLDGIFRARSGFPIAVLNSESALGLTFANVYRPSLNSDVPLWIADQNTPGGRRLNRDAFIAKPYVQGNLGRNAIDGFGMSQLDLALRREFPFKEQRLLQLRLEAFNIFNQANFADPIRYLSNPLFGQSPSMLNLMMGTGSPGSGLTPIFQTGGPRSIQVVLRYRF